MNSTHSGTRTASETEVSTSTDLPASDSERPRKHRGDRRRQKQTEPGPPDDDRSGERRLFRAGDKVSDRYRIVKFIARGGMGEVYAALDAELGQPVALKAVRPEVALHSQTLRRFRREINLSRKVTHQNVCRIYDVGTHYSDEQDLSIRYLTMELLEGFTLTRFLRKNGAISTEEALPIVVQIASGLGAAHDAGVVHRDFKTSNVLLAETSRGLRAVITDFGLSQTLNEDGTTPVDSDKLTGTGQLMGTLAYLSPEQLEGKPSSAATDIYSLGVVLYQMVTGHLPFDGGSPLMAALKRLHEDPPDPHKYVPELDEVWREVVLRCLERDPAKRYQSADELLAALGVESLADSSTSILRPILERRRSSYGTDAYEAPPPVSAEGTGAAQGPGTGSTEVPLPSRALPLWKAVALALAAVLVALGLTQVMPRLLAPPEIEVLVAAPVVFGDDADFIASSFEAAVLRGLSSLEGVRPLDSSKVQGVEGPPEELLRTAAADELVELEVRDVGREWNVEILRRGRDGQVLAVDSFLVVQDDSRLQADAIQAGVRRVYPDRDVLDGAGDLEISSEDYAEFLQLRYAIERDPGDLTRAEVLRRLTALRKRAPEFTEILLYEARAAAYLYRMSLDSDYLERAYRALNEARKKAPRDPRPLEQVINLAAVEPDLALAEQALENLRDVAPGEVVTLRASATVAEANDRFEDAIAFLFEACEIQRTPRCLTDLSSSLRKLGKTEEAISTLETVIAEWPTYWWGYKLLAGFELVHGDLERARTLYQRVLDRSDPDLQVATNLSLIYLLQEDYRQALDMARLAASRYPNNTTLMLSHAEAEELTGNTELARDLYRRLLERVDEPEGSEWGGWSLRAQALAHLGQHAEAKASVEKVLALGEGTGLAHLEAAVVYAILGDRDVATAQARRARELGVAEHFFRLPWLKPLGI